MEVSVLSSLVEARPTTFVYDAPSPGNLVMVVLPNRDFRSHNGGSYELDATHAVSVAATGTAEDVPTGSSSVFRLQGVFATTLEANSSCTPDSMGFGCDDVRVRGAFKGFYY